MTTTPVHKLLVALHVLAAVRYDDEIPESINALTRRVGDSAQALPDDVRRELDDWLQRNGDVLISRIERSLGEARMLSTVQLRVTLHALYRVLTHRPDALEPLTLAGELTSLSRALRGPVSERPDPDLVQRVRQWVGRRSDALGRSVRGLLR
jgi:hypothetical protein